MAGSELGDTEEEDETEVVDRMEGRDDNDVIREMDNESDKIDSLVSAVVGITFSAGATTVDVLSFVMMTAMGFSTDDPGFPAARTTLMLSCAGVSSSPLMYIAVILFKSSSSTLAMNLLRSITDRGGASSCRSILPRNGVLGSYGWFEGTLVWSR